MKTTTTKIHAGLHVNDITKSVGFYRELFNSEPVKVKEDYAKFETDEIVLSLILRPGHVHPGFGHFGIKVDSNAELQAYHNRMKSCGHQLIDEENVDCCYAVQDKFWVKDPDGFDWEVYTFIEDTDNGIRPEPVSKEAAEACCSPGCCD